MKIFKTLMLIAIAITTTLNAYCFDDQIDKYNELGKAIWYDQPDEVQRLLDEGVSPNQMQATITPIGIAVEMESYKCMDILLAQSGIDVKKMYTVVMAGDMPTRTNRNVLLSAILNGNIKLAKKFLEMGVECDFLSETYYSNGKFVSSTTPLLEVLPHEKTKGSVELAQLIADKTTNINRMFLYSKHIADDFVFPDVSVLYRMIEYDCKKPGKFNSVIISLMERGADYKTYFPLPAKQDELLTRYLSPADLKVYKAQQKYINYLSCIKMAATRGNAEVMQYMIDHGTPYERYDDKGAFVFFECSTIECVEILLKCGVDINISRAGTMPLLIKAGSTENYDLVDGMLKHGADPYITFAGQTLSQTMAKYPSSRKRKLAKIYKKYGFEF